MKQHLTILLSSTLLFACGKSKEAPKAEPAPAEPAPAPTAAAPTAAPVDAAPAAPTWSPEEGARLVEALAQCEYDFKCDAYQPLVGFGAKAAPGLAQLAADRSKPAKGRAVAAKALGEIKDPAQGKLLFDAATAEEDFMLRGDLYEAAGASGSEAVLAAAGARLLTDDGWKQRTELQKAIVPFGAKAFAWASAELGKAKPKFQTALADVVKDTAQQGDLPALQAMIPTTKDEMAKTRLAARAVELGDAAQVAVLSKHLEDKDAFVRMDAAIQLGHLGKTLTPEQKSAAIAAIEQAKGKAAAADQSMFDGALRDLQR